MKKSIFKRVAASAAAIALALVGVVALGSKAELKAAVTEVDLSDLSGYDHSQDNLFKVCEDWGAEVVIDEDVNVSFQLDETYSDDDMIAIQLAYVDGGWTWHHDYVDAVYSADETYKVTVPAGTYHMFQIAPSSEKDGAGDDLGSVCWQYDFKNVTTTTGEEEAGDDAAYYVAGEEALCGDGKNWDPAGSLMEKNADGTYSITFTGIAAGTYEFKVTDGTWDNSWNLDGNANTAGNAWVDVDEDDSTVVITFDGERVSVEVNPVAEDPEDPEDPATEEPGDGFVLTGTSVTMKDGGIRINVYNPWGGDDTHAVESMAPIDGAVKVEVTVKVTGLEASGLGNFKMWLNGGSNVDGNAVSYWESDGSKKDGCQSTVVEVSEDGEYTVVLTSEVAWAAGDNNFLAVMTDIDADAWNALNGGEGDTGLLSITGVNAVKAEPATDVPSGDSAHTALIIALIFAGAASVAAVVSKKVTVAEK